jgi:DNA-binding transcriptional LysR family regulator
VGIGIGIGICQAGLARRDAALVRLMPRTFSMKLETWITMHEDLRSSPRCRAAFDALVNGLQQYIGAPAQGTQGKIGRARTQASE